MLPPPRGHIRAIALLYKPTAVLQTVELVSVIGDRQMVYHYRIQSPLQVADPEGHKMDQGRHPDLSREVKVPNPKDGPTVSSGCRDTAAKAAVPPLGAVDTGHVQQNT